MGPQETAPESDHRTTSASPWRYLWAVADAALIGVWTATRELDDRPARRRAARAMTLLGGVPLVVLRAHHHPRTPPADAAAGVGPGTERPHDEDGDQGSNQDDDDDATAPKVALLVIGGVLGVVMLVGSHRLETAMLRALRRRGFRRPAVVLGAAIAVLQLLVSAAELRSDPDGTARMPEQDRRTG